MILMLIFNNQEVFKNCISFEVYRANIKIFCY